MLYICVIVLGRTPPKSTLPPQTVDTTPVKSTLSQTEIDKQMFRGSLISTLASRLVSGQSPIISTLLYTIKYVATTLILLVAASVSERLEWYKIQDTRKLYYLKREINTWIMLSLALKNYESLHNTETAPDLHHIN